MESRLSEVQKRLLQLLLASLLIAVVVRPEPGNRRYTAALQEVENFRAHFAPREAEAQLQAQAAAQGTLSLASVVEAANMKRGPKLKLSPEASAPKGVTNVSLATLADAHRFAGPDARLSVGVPDARALGESLAWRVARSGRGAAATLLSVQLVGAEVSAEEADEDTRVGELRLASLAARSAMDEADRRADSLEARVEKRKKRRSRSLDKVEAQLQTALAAREAKSAAHAEAQGRYDAAVARADRPRKRLPLGKEATAALVLARVQQAGETIEYAIPVRLSAREVQVAALPGAEFEALYAAGLWGDVSGLTPADAIRAIQSHFNWHYREYRVLGLALRGAALLSLLPCILPLLLGLLWLKMQRAEAFYSPFRTKVPSSLPRIGFRHRSLEFGALVLLPSLGPVFSGVAMGLVHQLPVLPALNAIFCALLGGLCFIKLDELRSQAISIVRSHSYPPPAADLSALT